MDFYFKLALYAVSAELFRRFVTLLIGAFTGPLAKIPGPLVGKFTTLPWLVNTIQGETMNTIPELFKKYGEVVRTGPKLVVFADKAGVRKMLLETDLPKSPIYDKMRIHQGNATLFTETDKAALKVSRRLLSAGFSIAYLNGLEPHMRGCIRVFEDFLDSECKKSNGSAVVDMSLVLSNLAFVMSATAFGGSFNMVTSNDVTLKESITQLFARQVITFLFPIARYLPFIPSGQSPSLIKMTEDIIATRQAEMAQKLEVKKDILQIILNAQQTNPELYTEQRVRDEMNMFMAAGTDTTSHTITCALLLLVNNPKKLKYLVAELDRAFPSKNDPITFAKTQDLPYLNAVINEALRLLPIISAGVSRITTETTILGNYEIPPGVEVLAWVSAKMVDPALWPDADDFVPERWLGKYKSAEVDRAVFIPFSIGSRNCIGQQFAMKEMRLVLATLVRRYELTLVPGQSHKLFWSLVPRFRQGFYNVGVKPRM
ncbi:cytochrome P450 [Hyaloscypha variabilis F]|uniref:Cytochrome P450 n=1 Tax=Hyaloscypha variabilis (strain UAMH 11265 / GT02V1 / F) TaxID=1149755 RepID=A0A2J6QWZ4_HYAVF|nr:cytochrome P450 [Hyaloscypha variabilis F]